LKLGDEIRASLAVRARHRRVPAPRGATLSKVPLIRRESR
jgi:hypothetical protein